MTDEDNMSGMDAEEQRLAARFQRLRAEDSARAPALPDIAAAPEPGNVVAMPSRWRENLPRIAAGVGVVGVALLLVARQPVEDPAALYLSVLEQQPEQMDFMLDVSAGVLPSLLPEPELYQFDVNYETEGYLQ